MKSYALNIRCCSLSNHKVAETIIKQNKSKCRLQYFLEEEPISAPNRQFLHKNLECKMFGTWYFTSGTLKRTTPPSNK